jgi:transcriptional regulator with XRE-family HTH domain
MFSDLLLADRERNGLTVEQMARRLGVSPLAYRKFEAGERWPDWATNGRIARTFLLPPSVVTSRAANEAGDSLAGRGSSLRLGSSRGDRYCGDRDRSDAAAEAMCWSVHGYMSAARGGERLHAFRAELAASLDRDRWWGSACVASARCDKHASRPER